MRRAVECLRTWCAGPPHTCIPETQVWSRNRCCRTTQEGSQAGRHLASAKNVDVVFERSDDVRDKSLAAVVIRAQASFERPDVAIPTMLVQRSTFVDRVVEMFPHGQLYPVQAVIGLIHGLITRKSAV